MVTPIFSFITDFASTGLEVFEIGNRRDFHITIQTGHPDFEIVSERGRIGSVLGAEKENTVGKIELFQDIFRV